MNTPSVAKAGFVCSLMMLSFVYGFAARWHGWFPDALLERASRQATGLQKAWGPGPADEADRVYDRTGSRTLQPDAVQPGVTLVISSWDGQGEWTPEVRLMDREGTVLHRWRIDRNALFPDSSTARGGLPSRQLIHGSHLRPNGDLLVNLQYIGTVRLDACGRVRWRVPYGSHHSIAQAEDGSYWISGTTRMPQATTDRYPEGFQGLDGPTWLDQILHVAPDGRVLDRINVLDLLYANGLEYHLARVYQPDAETDAPRTKDLTHMNDVEPLPASMEDEYPLFEAGDLLVSLRDLHLVLVVDPTSRTVKWHAAGPFVQQHDPDFMGEGWIGVFDNRDDFTPRGTMLGGSRILALQPHTDSTKVLFPTSHSAPFYTDIRGKWQHLDNGNLLLTESMAGRVVEVTPDGRTAWEWIKAPRSDSKVPVVSEGTRYGFSPAQVESWPSFSKELVRAPNTASDD